MNTYFINEKAQFVSVAMAIRKGERPV